MKYQLITSLTILLGIIVFGTHAYTNKQELTQANITINKLKTNPCQDQLQTTQAKLKECEQKLPPLDVQTPHPGAAKDTHTHTRTPLDGKAIKGPEPIYDIPGITCATDPNDPTHVICVQDKK